MRTMMTAASVLVAVALGQSYKSDWSVVGIAGGDMVGSVYKCGSTVGQKAAGRMTGSSYWALLGFWQPELASGVREQAQLTNPGSFVTRLYAPQPNPGQRRVSIRFTLDAQRQTSLRIHDLTGRVVRTLCASSMERGAHSITWNGTDGRGRFLANGTYFVRLTAGNCSSAEKLVLQR